MNFWSVFDMWPPPYICVVNMRRQSCHRHHNEVSGHTILHASSADDKKISHVCVYFTWNEKWHHFMCVSSQFLFTHNPTIFQAAKCNFSSWMNFLRLEATHGGILQGLRSKHSSNGYSVGRILFDGRKNVKVGVCDYFPDMNRHNLFSILVSSTKQKKCCSG